ncbi:HWE histidine kinase domain-containing protein [Parvularcula sp. LCG005]|uniref:HWE histidine kinase domain-containing protein n=1 Tax=Parvularcula sp. LCG005 TaxID=3078805 RepID=UPI002942CF5F|nr:HWE histidine kinase domain-containing protein [Parvularcula sp. LCG005]WOI53181.1 HWE histidine kinase domain-containing protein [Parvularcula sp. LCG005]
MPTASGHHPDTDFHVLANAIPQMAWMARPDGWIFWYNERWYSFTGTTLPQMEGDGWRSVHHPDHVERVTETFRNAIENQDAWEDTFPLRGADGQYRWFLSRALPVRDQNGNILRWFGTNTDITEQKQAEERQSILMREVDHRAKNALAVAQAVVNLTKAPDIAGYKSAVKGRIAALARAHQQLALNKWNGTDMEALIQEELAPFVDGDATGTLQTQGAPIVLPPALAQSATLVIHELATNAAKYGALSNEAGTVLIDWKPTVDGLHIRWTEKGGPPVTAPTRVGFGMTLLDASVKQFSGGSVNCDWRSDGLVCELVLPMKDAAKAVQAEEAPAETSTSTARKVLVVEDEALTALDLEWRLQDAGYEVLGPAGTLQAANDILKTDRPSIALLDTNLNGERTFTLAMNLLADDVPVIFCTGYNSLDDAPRALAGCPIVQKPYQEKALLTAINKLLEESSSV